MAPLLRRLGVWTGVALLIPVQAGAASLPVEVAELYCRSHTVFVGTVVEARLHHVADYEPCRTAKIPRTLEEYQDQGTSCFKLLLHVTPTSFLKTHAAFSAKAYTIYYRDVPPESPSGPLPSYMSGLIQRQMIFPVLYLPGYRADGYEWGARFPRPMSELSAASTLVTGTGCPPK